MKIKNLLFWVTFYSIAMGFLESAVVIYLRQLLYPGPDGFTFPLRPMHHNLALVEVSREAATIVMLMAIGAVAGKSKAEKFAWFLYSFAIWDIFYYVFLYVFLGWPQNLMTWDILFLIPVPWVGPVLSPVIIDIVMILFALTIVRYSIKKSQVALRLSETLMLLTGGFIVVCSFTYDYVVQYWPQLYRQISGGRSLLSEMYNYSPAWFNWYLFSFGALIMIFSYITYLRRLSLFEATQHAEVREHYNYY